MQPRLLLALLLLCCLAQLTVTSTTNSFGRPARVHIIFMNHLDVGYNGIPSIGYINNVLNHYFTVHFPQALNLLQQMEQSGFTEKFRYTTHPWLLDMYLNCPNITLNNIALQCPNGTQLDAMKNALNNGQIIWHAGPMNMQLENMNAELIEASLNISRRLDAQFQPKKKIRVLSQRDVPGMTNQVISVLKRNQVVAVSVGVNGGSYPPEVTREPFLWQDEYTGQSIIGIWHPGGYPNNPGDSPNNPGGLSVRDCSMISGVPEILCFSFRTDNNGPPQSVAEVLSTYEILSNEFPGAELIASTLEDYVTAIMPYQSLMQVVRTEIGDTWIQGIASDPRKMAEYRALSRAFTRCYHSGQCPSTDKQVQEAVRYMIKPPEHTWGLPSQPDQNNYKNVDFYKVKNTTAYINNENAWNEQRMFNNFSVQAAKSHPLSSYMNDELQQIVPAFPPLDQYDQTDFLPDKIQTCDHFEFSFHSDGSLDHLRYKDGDVNFADPQSRLARFVYRSYDEDDDNKLLRSYGNPGYGKPNITKNANPRSAKWPLQVQKFFKSKTNCTFILQLVMQDSTAVTDYGAPEKVFVTFDFNNQVDIELLIWNKSSTRIEEGLFFEFLVSTYATQSPKSCKWWLNKVGGYVDPLRVTYGGTVLQHVVTDHAMLLCNAQRTRTTLLLQSKDVPLACPFNRKVEASPFPYLDRLTSVDGVSFNIYNNVWITNYIFWYPFNKEDANFKARFSIVVSQQ